MTKKTLGLEDTLYHYFQSVSLRENPVLQQLREETAKLPMSQMQIAPEQGQFMGLLVQLIQAKKTLEIGVFTGYSALAVALALPSDGKIIACDVDEEYTAIARRYWQKANMSHQIDLKLAPALETLEQLIANGETETFDFVFIDADKRNYVNYYEKSLQLLKKGGLIAVDNVFWSGKVADSTVEDKQTQAIRDFNEKVFHDERVSLSLVPIADGLTLAMKR